MQKLNALIKLGLALALFAGIAHAQSANNGYPYSSLSGAPTVLPTFVGSTFVTTTAASNASLTTPSYTPYANGDLMVVGCRADPVSDSAFVITSSPAETWHTTAFQLGTSLLAIQASWAVLSSGAAHTFTCTPTVPSTYIGIAAVEISGTLGTLNTSASNSITATTFPANRTYPSASITTTQRTVNLYYGSYGATGYLMYPGSVNGVFGTLIATDAATPQSTAGSSWFEMSVTPRAATFYADVWINDNTYGAGVLIAFNY
jgi:hypothetical protein